MDFDKNKSYSTKFRIRQRNPHLHLFHNHTFFFLLCLDDLDSSSSITLLPVCQFSLYQVTVKTNYTSTIVRPWLLFFSISIYSTRIIRARRMTTFVFMSEQCCYIVKNISSGNRNITVTDSDKYR